MGGTFVCIECDFTQCAVENKSTAFGSIILEELKCPLGKPITNWRWLKGIGSASVISIPSNIEYFAASKIEIIDSQKKSDKDL